MNTKFYHFLLAFSIIALASCSDDDDSDNNNPSGGGGDETVDSYITFSVTGDETAEFSSNATTALQGSPANGYDFIISGIPEDIQAGIDFTIYFTSKYIDTPPLPIPTGSFDLIAESESENGDGNYATGFTNFETGTGFGYEVTGTLNITESTDNYVEGDFNFTTTSFTSGEEEVTIEGSFLAPTTY